MKKFTLENLIEELKTTDYTKEKEKEPNKMYYVIDTVYGVKTLLVKQRSETAALCGYLSNRLTRIIEREEQNINFGNLGEYPRIYYNYKDLEEIYITYLEPEEEQSINRTLEHVEEFSKANTKYFYYMEERNTQDDYIYNYLAFFHRELTPEEQQAEPYITHFYNCNKISQYTNDRVSQDIKKEKEKREQAEPYIKAFETIFNNNLHFNIDLKLNYGKAGDIAEQIAAEIVARCGAYNDFNIMQFEKILNFCNKHFIKYYNEGNPNNNSRNYTIKFGREGSPVIYIEAHTKTEEEASEIFTELKHITNADEAHTIEQKNSYFGIYNVWRLWWD